jgi:hypothetical protein
MKEELVSAKSPFGGRIAVMKALRKAIKDKRVLVFVDLEGTQFTHEMIEIGAYVAYLDDDLHIKKHDKGFTTYVKATNPIGRVVVTEYDWHHGKDLIKKKGVSPSLKR